MIKQFNAIFCLVILVISFQSCNPECDSFTNTSLTISPSPLLPGSEFLITSSLPNFLNDQRKVYIDDDKDPSKKVALESTFNTSINAIVATLPNTANGNTPIYIDEPDCNGDFLFINPLQVENEDFFLRSSEFIIPPIPIVIIPTPLPPGPVDVTNAWISPQNRAYCIWLVPERDAEGKTLPQLRPKRDSDLPVNAFVDPINGQGSRELPTPPCADEANIFTGINPITGIVDPENNVIRLEIDRTSKGLGTEVLTGFFIDGNSIPAEYRNGSGCSEGSQEATLFMKLISEKTGQELFLAHIS